MDKETPKKNCNLKNIVSQLPKTTGVYILLNKNNEIIYIGKARNIYKRVSDHLLTKQDNLKEEILKKETNLCKFQETPTEFDALLLEANLIGKYLPKYNAVARDDSSPLYIQITLNEELPHIYINRQKNIQIKTSKYGKDIVFGPFQSNNIVKSLLQKIRKIIPFCQQKQRTGKSCFYTQLGLCDPCPSKIVGIRDSNDKKEYIKLYRRHIKQIIGIFNGKSMLILRELEQEMKHNARNHLYEQAILSRNHIQSYLSLLQKRHDPLFFNQIINDIQTQGLKDLVKALSLYFPNLVEIKKIECIDISNLQGKNATGSVVVSQNGLSDMGSYRKFKIKSDANSGDACMIGEVLKRRLNHPEWNYPDLIVVDGGKSQLKASLNVIKSYRLSIPIIGLAKKHEEIYVLNDNKYFKISLPLSSPALHLIQRLRDESHRFAKSYHIKLRAKTI